MKKKQLFYLFLLSSTTFFAQNSQETFLETTWYLSRIEVQGETYYISTFNLIHDYTLINSVENNDYSFEQTQCSNTSQANFTFVSDNLLNISQYTVTSAVCPLENLATFFNFLNYNVFSVNENLNFQYEITPQDSFLQLMIKAPNGNAAYYYNVTTANTKTFNGELLKVYPNPTVDFLNILISDLDKVEIFDMLGKRILSPYNSTENGTQIDIQHLVKGNYILQISKDNQTENIKFIKE